MPEATDPHGEQPVLTAGAPIQESKAVLVMLHGRGAGAQDMLGLFDELHVADVCALAPEAADRTWYPHSFLAPLESNQPYLDSALQKVTAIVHDVIAQGKPPDQIAILGFSQGACLACEFVARSPARYGAVMALTGGLIGPPGLQRSYSGSLDGTPVFLGTSDPDQHIPIERVIETRDILTAMGATVDMRAYPGMPHTINTEELDVCRQMLQAILQPKNPS